MTKKTTRTRRNSKGMEPGTVDLPLQTRDATIPPESVDEEARTVEVVWSTGAVVRRRMPFSGEPYEEELSLDPAHADLSRLNGGAPLLDTHGAWSLDGVIGVVERAWIEDGNHPVGKAIVRFSERDDVEPVWRDVKAGIIRNISVGYSVRTYEISEEPGKVPRWRAIDWTPAELSAVPVGADPDAGFRGAGTALHSCKLITRAALAHTEEEHVMEDMENTNNAAPEREDETRALPDTNTDAETVSGNNGDSVNMERRPDADVARPDPTTIAEHAVEAERGRIAGIYDSQAKLAVERNFADNLVRQGTPLDEARSLMIDQAAHRDQEVETRSQITMGGLDERQTRRQAVEVALLHRFDPNRFQLTEPARDWRGYSLLELARNFLKTDGVRVRGLSRDEIATRALHSTSDFPHILAAVTNKTLREAYEAAPRTFHAIARRASASDFKDINRLQLGEAPQLEKVNESGEFKRGTMGEAKESYRVETYGKVVGITRQVIINDDLDAFTRVPFLFGTSAATLESDVVWSIVTANPKMHDTKALFHADHKNLAAAGTDLDVANLGKSRAAMAKQVGLDGKTILNVRPAFLVVPSTLELTAEQIIAQNLVPTKSGDVVPQSIRSLAVISEPRLDPTSGAVPWYLFASPNQIDTIEYAYLDGQDGVFIETRMGFDVDGVEIKARLDFGAKAIDWRGIFKNPGVAG
jgi:hypothetical protein